MLESRGYAVMAFCGLADHQGQNGRKKIFPKAPKPPGGR